MSVNSKRRKLIKHVSEQTGRENNEYKINDLTTPTGFEPVFFAVTGRRDSQLHQGAKERRTSLRKKGGYIQRVAIYVLMGNHSTQAYPCFRLLNF